MILTCPECGTRYAVKDGAIPEGGRQVRCASCKHSWHQDPDPQPGDEALDEAPPEQPTESPPAEESAGSGPFIHPAGEEGSHPAEASLSDHAHPDLPAETADHYTDPDASPLPEPGAAELVGSPEPDWYAEPPQQSSEPLPPEPEAILPDADPVRSSEEQGWSGVRHAPAEIEFPAYVSADEPEEPRRRGLVGLLLALLLIAALVAAFWFLAPAEWKQRMGIAQVEGSPVMVQLDETNRRTLASGNELLEVTGKVINPTDQPQRVPQIEAMLRTYSQKVVHRWIIPPPAPMLPPGGSAPFNSAELLSIPADAACLSVLARSTDEAKLEPCTPASQQVANRPS